MHDLLVVGAVVVHDGEERDAVVGAGPEDAGSVHQVAIVLDVDGEAAVLAVSDGRPEGRGGTVADARAARSGQWIGSVGRNSKGAAATHCWRRATSLCP